MSASEMKRSGIELGHCGVKDGAVANARRSEMAISSVKVAKPDAGKEGRTGSRSQPGILLCSMDSSKTLKEKRAGTAAIRSKIRMIFLLSAARIGSCKANSAPPFLSATV